MAKFSLIKLALTVVLIHGDDCPYKECYCANPGILCNFRDLEAMPKLLFNNNPIVQSLDLYGNQITTIPAGSFPANLSGVFLQGNPIETIDDTAFDESIYTLQELYFSGAEFTQIPEAVFHLKALNSLNIDQTNILVWNEDGMQRLGSTMQTLSLTTVGLTSWPIWMKSMTNLTQLTITGNTISIIPDDALNLMAKTLMILDLSHNGLTKLPKSMSNLTVLKSLTLNYNKIVDVTWLPQLSPLATLYIENNKIGDAQNLSYALRPFAKTLKDLNIQNNSLTSIPELSLLTQLRSLNFQFNHITDSNSGSLPSALPLLNLDNNFLSSIPRIIKNLKIQTQLYLDSNNIYIMQGSYIPASALVLYISFNSISQLTRNSFPSNSSLITLILNNNPVSIVSPDAFTNIPLLTQLNLQSTELTRLPLALASLTKINYIDFSNSKSLICTCQEQSLRPWITSIGSYSITGDCGMTSVYFFFTVLSRDCPPIL